MLKVELHTHTADDPLDYIPHSVHELIDRAVSLGYQALAITLHDKQLDLKPFRTYAADRGVVLISGVERTIDGCHVLLLNFPLDARADRIRTFEGIGRLKADMPTGIVVAPHPFFPLSFCLGDRLDRYADLFDAVEQNALYSRHINFNTAVERWAREHQKPVVGNADVHRLEQLGYTYSLVDACPEPDAICVAIRNGEVMVESRPLGTLQLGLIVAKQLSSGVIGRWTRRHAATHG